jgi:phosphate-selective porin OprO/OprP
LELRGEQASEQVRLVRAEFSLGEIRDEDATRVHHEGDAHFGAHLAEDVADDGIEQELAELLMEPAAVLQALAPGRDAGFQIGRPVFHERATWSLGLFAPGGGTLEYGNASEDFGNAVGRITWLPIYHPDPDDPSANRYLHLGLSANFLYSASSSVRYQSRPESRLAPVVIDTGDIDAHSAATIGIEAAWVHGPLTLQGEFIGSMVRPTERDNLAFFGFYGSASWYLTGESRPYNLKTGTFKRPAPRNEFHFGRDGWGALEAAARFSYCDLSDGDVRGGRLTMFTTGLNWYPHPHIRWMFDVGIGNRSASAANGNLFIFQTRVGVDF